MTVVISTIALIGVCLLFAPSSLSHGALEGSLPFAAIIAIVGLGQLLVVQQGGFDLSLAGGVSLAVVISTHYPQGDDALLLPAVLIAIACAIVAGLANGILVSLFELNAIVATIGVNAFLYGGVFAVSGGVPKTTTNLVGRDRWRPRVRASEFSLFRVRRAAGGFIHLEKVCGWKALRSDRRKPVGCPGRGLRVQLYQLLAYVYAQLLYCMAGLLLAGITREPTAFQGDSLLLPSVAVVVLGGTSLLGGRGFPISTVIASFFLNQLSQFALAVGVPYSAQTIIQALALGFGIGVYSIRWTANMTRRAKPV